MKKYDILDKEYPVSLKKRLKYVQGMNQDMIKYFSKYNIAVDHFLSHITKVGYRNELGHDIKNSPEYIYLMEVIDGMCGGEDE